MKLSLFAAGFLAIAPIWAEQAPSKLRRVTRVIVVQPRISPKWEAANLGASIVGNLIGQWMMRRRGPDAWADWDRDMQNEPTRESEFVAPYREPAIAPIAIFTVESNQPDSEVLIDSKPHGIAPVLVTLESGTRYVVVRRDGFRDWTQEVKANPGDALTVHAELKPIPEESSVIAVKAQHSPR